MNNYMKKFLSVSMSIIFTGIASLAIIPISDAAPRQAQSNGRLIDKTLKAKLPSYYPDRFMGTGIVTEINPKRRSITIGSTIFTQGINTKVHTLSSNFASIQNLPIDTPVGYNFFVGTDNTFFLTEAWVLPVGSVLAH